MRGGENWKHARGVQHGEAVGVSFFDDEPDAPNQVAIYIRDESGGLTPGRTVDLTTPGHAESVITAWIKHRGAPENNCADPVIKSRVAAIIAGADERAAADRLAAAAPELLAAIEPIFANAFSNGELATRMRISPERVALVRAAIAKAEGRTS